MESLTIDFFEGKDVREIDKSLPPGRVIFGDRKVRSKPLRPNDGKSEHRCIINGKTDTIVEFEDGTYGIVDFKTSAINDKKAKIYGSYSITKIDETRVDDAGTTVTFSNKFSFTLINAATSIATGGGFFVFGGPVNDRS